MTRNASWKREWGREREGKREWERESLKIQFSSTKVFISAWAVCLYTWERLCFVWITLQLSSLYISVVYLYLPNPFCLLSEFATFIIEFVSVIHLILWVWRVKLKAKIKYLNCNFGYTDVCILASIIIILDIKVTQYTGIFHLIEGKWKQRAEKGCFILKG